MKSSVMFIYIFHDRKYEYKEMRSVYVTKTTELSFIY